MGIEFPCPSCGRRLRAEEQYQGRQTRCPSCGAAAFIPAPAEAIQSQPAVRTVRAVRDADTAPCPECGTTMAAEAVLCIECGYDRRTGRLRTTKVRRFDRDWNTGVPMPGRLIALFVTATSLSVVSIYLILHFQLPNIFFAITFAGIVGIAVVNLGTFSFLRLLRTKKGRLLIFQDSYFAFIPLGRSSVDLADCLELRLLADEDKGAMPGFSGLMYFAVAFCGGILAATIWYAYSSSKVHMVLRLVGKRDRDTLTLYSGTDDNLMRDIVNTIQESSNLPLQR